MTEAEQCEEGASQLDRIVGELVDALYAGRSLDAARLRSELDVMASHLVATAPLPLVEVAVSDLPNGPGIYVIRSSTYSYVGLATDVHHRFHNVEYGHLTKGNRSRSRLVLEDPAATVLLVADELGQLSGEALSRELSRREIRAYALLRSTGAVLVNSLAMLGRSPATKSSPVVLCDLSTGEVQFAESLAAATQFVGSSALPAVVHGYQKTAVGYAARWATEAEGDALLELCADAGLASGAAVDRVVSLVDRDVQWTGSGRNSGFRWAAGQLSDSDRAALSSIRRGAYQTSGKSSFKGVDRVKGGGWHIRAKRNTAGRPL